MNQRAALPAATGLCVAYFALWACAPAATVRPNAPMQSGKTMAVGGAVAAAGAIKRVSSSNEFDVICQDTFETGRCLAGHIWGHRLINDRWSFGGSIFGGSSSLFGGGMYLRYLMSDPGPLRVSVDVSAGWLWASVGVPISYDLGRGAWLYTNPSIGARAHNAARLPIGLAVDLGGPRLQVEAGVGFTGSEGSLNLASELQVTSYTSLGLEWQF